MIRKGSREQESVIREEKFLTRDSYPLSTTSGFSLVEAMVASLLLAIGFTGVFSLTGIGSDTMHIALLRQKLQISANSILEAIEDDVAGIDNYNLDLTDCTAAGSGDKHEVRRADWCNEITALIGPAQDGDVRSIAVSDAGGSKIVTVQLEAQSGRASMVSRRAFND